MASNKKIDKALYGPSTFEVALGALLGLLVGVLAACLFLALKPVKTVKEMPKEPALGAVYYIPGKADGTKGRTWVDKQRQFLAGSTVLLTEEELNAWAATLNSSAPAPKPAAAKPGAKPAPAKPEEKPGEPQAGFFTAGPVVFRLVGSQLQAASKCTFNYFGLTADVQVIATGGFARKDNHIVFVPEKLYLGSCPLHKLPVLAGLVVPRIYASQKVSDELAAAWEKVTDITVEKDLLKVSTTP